MKIQSLSHGSLHWQEVLPPAFSGVRLPGASLKSATGDFGSLCIQEYKTAEFTIRYFVLDVLRHFVLRYKNRANGLCSQLALLGKREQTINSLSFSFVKNQLLLLSSPGAEVTLSFKEATVCHSLDTYFSKPVLAEIINDYPSLGQLTKELSAYPAKHLRLPKWADIETMELVSDILHCRYEKNLRHLFFQSHIRELLYKYLVLYAATDDPLQQPQPAEISAVYEAERIITDNIIKHYTIPEISKKVHLNEFRLKQLFKKIFGTGPYEYLVRLRMSNALPLLRSGLSVKEVAALTGYRPSDFTTAFIRFYGFTPSSVKK